MADPIKLSSKTALSPLLAFDRIAVVRRALDEPDASKRVFPATLPDAARAIGPVLPGPNFIPGAPKFARFKTQAQVTAAGAFGGNALDNSPGLLWCLLCPGTVEFDTDGQRNVTYLAVYDGQPRMAETPGFIVFRTGDFVAGDTIPAKLVRAASPEAGVPAYVERPATYAWAVGELTRAYVAGTTPELFFKRKSPGGTAPAPTSASGDANWEVVARESVPPPPAPTVLYPTTGQNTDGAMTQKATSAALALKADLNAAGQLTLTQRAPASTTELGNVRIGRGTEVSISGFLHTYWPDFKAEEVVLGLEAGGGAARPGRAYLITDSTAAGVFGLYSASSTSLLDAQIGTLVAVRSTVSVSYATGTLPSGSPNLINGSGAAFQQAAGEWLVFRRTATGYDIIMRGGTAAAPESFAALSVTTGSIVLDFNAATVQTLAATGNLAFSTANVALLKTKELYIRNDTGAAITLSGPAGWVFFPGPYPTSLAAGKQAVLTLRALGATDSTIKAAYVAQV